jgi:putative hydrolase of the HAD superfamily
MIKKYLLWDFDNTLAYRNGMWSQIIYDLINENGIHDVHLDDIRPYLTKGFPWHSHELSHKEFFKEVSWWDHMNLYFDDIIQKLGINPKLSQHISKQIKLKYLDVTKWNIYEDTIPCLEKAIENGYENIILSNHVPELINLVEELRLSKYFIKIYSSANLGYEKPNIQIYKKVIDEIGFENNITMIGDNNKADVEGALNADINAILVRKENSHNYSNYCSTLEELFNILERKDV